MASENFYSFQIPHYLHLNERDLFQVLPSDLFGGFK